MNGKWNALIGLLGEYERVAVAFSAGVDSTLLLKAAHEALGDNVLAVTGKSLAFPERENEEAHSFCESLGIRQITVEFDQTAVAGFCENPPERCYLCKRELFSAFLQVAHENGYAELIEGSNTDDLNDYRPGMRAVRELSVRSPLQEVGLSKLEIRELSAELNLPTWNKPSFACLATRFPYGERITKEGLRAVGEAEEYLIALGFRQVRVRAHGRLARIEVERAQIPMITEPETSDKVVERLRSLGFLYVSLDLSGYETGSMNKPLSSV